MLDEIVCWRSEEDLLSCEIEGSLCCGRRLEVESSPKIESASELDELLDCGEFDKGSEFAGNMFPNDDEWFGIIRRSEKASVSLLPLEEPTCRESRCSYVWNMGES
jgi:hypothetical protein